ncbi:MAG: hypothetical protein PWP49_429 [Thermococcaceae archaeon]|jgi:hypothetical protein|uniref:hypothetical protein n=1 Tax=Thermococcus TaxID=2263 RepID=UPI0005B25E46|nr:MULTISPECIES: hypothetical protein [Thermococcus]KUJ99303.1 MAG: hypothetical protein XD43_1035 [Thermococcales archaeon 44_46]MDK2783643.1 hypothetical protein [Thermococcaceae archaeon]MCA6214854.1 hypothetical protein [Thermococcus bergensis]MDK2853471.1 hypothetical protein [Thermococcaceae archaeon]MDK2982881.1 hypothetical protein [Thermococcaceae archaeon]
MKRDSLPKKFTSIIAVSLILIGIYCIVMTYYSIDFEQADADEFGWFLITIGVLLMFSSFTLETWIAKIVSTLILGLVGLIGHPSLNSLSRLFSKEPPALPNLIVDLTFTLLFPITVLTIILLWIPSIAELANWTRRNIRK